MDPTAYTRYAGNVDVLMLIAHLAAMGIDVGKDSQLLGFTKTGKPIWSMSGGDDAALLAKIEELTGEIKKLGDGRQDTNPEGKARDGARYAEQLEGSASVAAQLAELHALKAAAADSKAKEQQKADIQQAINEFMTSKPGQSMAANLGTGDRPSAKAMAVELSAVQKAIFGEDYESGSAFSAIAAFKGQTSDGIDIEAINAGKAMLQKLGMVYAGAPDLARGKATLGTTGATGGYVLPNNVVEGVRKPKTQMALYRKLVTVVPGVMVRAVDQPYRLGAPTRMVPQDWGAVKENVNETYGSYSAPLVTFARIYDVAKQYLRFSAGSAERDILDELAKAADLAENYEIIAGPGTGTSGSGDAITGVYTALNATPTFLGYKSAKTGAASNSTVAGSLASAFAEIMGLLASRNRTPEAIVVDATTYFTALAQGSDTAGFWVSPTGGPTGFTKTESGGIAYWGIPMFYDTNLTSNAAAKIAIAAEWSAFKLYRGVEFRIDSSDVAGERWDRNLVGFRGEMEFGFNAMTAVHVGAAQLMTAVIP